MVLKKSFQLLDEKRLHQILGRFFTTPKFSRQIHILFYLSQLKGPFVSFH